MMFQWRRFVQTISLAVCVRLTGTVRWKMVSLLLQSLRNRSLLFFKIPELQKIKVWLFCKKGKSGSITIPPLTGSFDWYYTYCTSKGIPYYLFNTLLRTFGMYSTLPKTRFYETLTHQLFICWLQNLAWKEVILQKYIFKKQANVDQVYVCMYVRRTWQHIKTQIPLYIYIYMQTSFMQASG